MDVFVLPDDELVLAEVGDVVHRRFGIELEEQPTDVRPEEALGNVIGVLVMIHVLVVAAMVGSPVKAGIFERTRAEDQGEKLHRRLRLEGKVGEQAVVADGDAHHRGRHVEEEEGELESVDADLVEVDGNPDEGHERGADEE